MGSTVTFELYFRWAIQDPLCSLVFDEMEFIRIYNLYYKSYNLYKN